MFFPFEKIISNNLITKTDYADRSANIGVQPCNNSVCIRGKKKEILFSLFVLLIAYTPRFHYYSRYEGVATAMPVITRRIGQPTYARIAIN